MKNLFLFSMFTLYSMMGIAQGGTTSAPSNFESTSQIMDIIEDKLRDEKVITYDLKDVVGSPYYQDAFMPGKMFLGDKDYGRFLFRYNIYRDEIELKTNIHAKLESIKKVNGVSIKLDDGTLLEVVNLKEENSIERHFVVQLTGTTERLAKKVYVKFDKPREADSPLSGKKRAKFIRKNEYYVLSKDNQYYIKITSNKMKDIIRLFPSKADTLASFIRNQKLNLKKEKDLVKLFAYINTI